MSVVNLVKFINDNLGLNEDLSILEGAIMYILPTPVSMETGRKLSTCFFSVMELPIVYAIHL